MKGMIDSMFKRFFNGAKEVSNDELQRMVDECNKDATLKSAVLDYVAAATNNAYDVASVDEILNTKDAGYFETFDKTKNLFVNGYVWATKNMETYKWTIKNMENYKTLEKVQSMSDECKADRKLYERVLFHVGKMTNDGPEYAGLKECLDEEDAKWFFEYPDLHLPRFIEAYKLAKADLEKEAREQEEIER